MTLPPPTAPDPPLQPVNEVAVRRPLHVTCWIPKDVTTLSGPEVNPLVESTEMVDAGSVRELDVSVNAEVNVQPAAAALAN
jgi:hypothetical protein